MALLVDEFYDWAPINGQQHESTFFRCLNLFTCWEQIHSFGAIKMDVIWHPVMNWMGNEYLEIWKE